MLSIKILAFILAEIGKHRPIVHVMAVDHAVVGQRKVAVFLHIGHAVIAVLLVKTPFQIEIRLVHGLHHGIVDVCAGNGEPAHKVTVLLLHRPILFKCRQLRQRLGFHQCGDLFKGFGGLFSVRILPTEHDAGEKEKGGTYGRPDHQIFVYVNKELQRVERDVVKKLDKKDIIFEFPILSQKNKTQLVLKKPKTATSTRKVFLPRTVAEMLVNWRSTQDELREALGHDYIDYDLVFAGYYGMPTEASSITDEFQRLIVENNLPRVVFHSLRHSSITYKLKLNGGDIKAVQGDSGHAQAKMVTDQYSHILDDDRKLNAQLFEDAFYQKKDVGEPACDTTPLAGSTGKHSLISEDDRQLLEKLMSDESAAALLMALVKKLT